MTSQEYERAKELGRQAGRNGAKPEACPYKGASLHSQRDAWEDGRIEGAAERKVRR